MGGWRQVKGSDGMSNRRKVKKKERETETKTKIETFSFAGSILKCSR